jgi:hypothetical protein
MILGQQMSVRRGEAVVDDCLDTPTIVTDEGSLLPKNTRKTALKRVYDDA